MVITLLDLKQDIDINKASSQHYIPKQTVTLIYKS